MNRALVLGGGGARGSFQLGMLEVLIVDQGLDFQTIRGVSVGALNAAFLAQAKTGDENSQKNLVARVKDLKKLWTDEIKGNDSVYEERTGWLGMIWGANSLFDLTPLRELVSKHVRLDALRKSGRNFAVGTTSLVTGKYQEWEPQTHSDFMEKLIASASIPVIFPFVDIPNRDALVDGGVRDITPLGSVFKADPPPDEIYVLLTSRMFRDGDHLRDSEVEEYDYAYWQDEPWTKISGFDVLLRTLDILTDNVHLGDIRGAIQWNAIIDAALTVSAVAGVTPGLATPLTEAVQKLDSALATIKKRKVPLYVIAPRVWFDPKAAMSHKNDATKFDPGLIAAAIQHGRTVAKDPKLWVWPPK